MGLDRKIRKNRVLLLRGPGSRKNGGNGGAPCGIRIEKKDEAMHNEVSYPDRQAGEALWTVQIDATWFFCP